MRLIDADNFLDLFYVAAAGQDKAFVATVEMVVADTPDVDAEPVRSGRWNEIEDSVTERLMECSVCKEWIMHHHNYVSNYCPNCGAKIEGDVNAE